MMPGQQMFDAGQPNCVEETDDFFTQHLPPGARLYCSAGWSRVTLADGRTARVSSMAATAIEYAWYLYNGTGKLPRRVTRVSRLDSSTGEIVAAEAIQHELW